MNPAEKHCRMADIILCLGTSLQVTPACNLPLKSLRGGGKIIIVNLQQTPKDNKASLVIHGPVDKVISGVMHFLNLQIAPYIRVDLFQIIFKQYRTSETKYAQWSLKVSGVHGESAPLPFIKSVEVSFPERPELKSALLCKQPFLLRREMLISRPIKLVLTLYFSDGCGCKVISIDFPINFQALAETINQDRDLVVQKLKEMATQDQCCGQLSLVERTLSVSAPRKQSTIYAVATNIIHYDGFSLQSSEFSGLCNEDEKEKKEVDLCGDGSNSVKRHGDVNANGVPVKKVKF